MNSILLTGRLTDKPKERITKNGIKNATFFLAVDKKLTKEKKKELTDAGKETADFIFCVGYKKLSEIILNNLGKGDKVLVQGTLNINNYKKDGEFKSFTSVIIDRLEFLERRKDIDDFEDYDIMVKDSENYFEAEFDEEVMDYKE